MHAPKEYTLSHMINHLCVHPRKILKQASVSIATGCNAELALFDPLREWEYNASTNLSLSQNSPLLNQTLKGKVIATINKNHFYTH
jgi:dihydroorotase